MQLLGHSDLHVYFLLSDLMSKLQGLKTTPFLFSLAVVEHITIVPVYVSVYLCACLLATDLIDNSVRHLLDSSIYIYLHDIFMSLTLC